MSLQEHLVLLETARECTEGCVPLTSGISPVSITWDDETAFTFHAAPLITEGIKRAQKNGSSVYKYHQGRTDPWVVAGLITLLVILANFYSNNPIDPYVASLMVFIYAFVCILLSNGILLDMGIWAGVSAKQG